MSRFGITLSVLCLSSLLAACSSSTAEKWEKNDDIGLGVGLSYPTSFVPESLIEGDVASGTGTLHLQQVRLRRSQGADGTIMMMRSNNRSLLASLQSDSPFEPVTIAGKNLLKFSMSGEGNPMGYVIQQEPDVIAVAFANVEDDQLIENVVESIEVK